MTIFYILLVVVAIAAIWLWVTYNGLVKMHTRVDEALSDITIQMKRRLDLIPNIVNAVKGYAKHEKSTLNEVTKARNLAMAAPEGDLSKQAEADNMLSGALKSLFAVSESYPDLKANQNFLQLQQELVDTEDKIQASRRFYNGNVRDFNIKLKVFPTNTFAKSLGFTPYQFFEVSESEKTAVEKAPDVNFDDDAKK